MAANRESIGKHQEKIGGKIEAGLFMGLQMLWQINGEVPHERSPILFEPMGAIEG
jgi:hypothetical protein